MYSMHLWMGGNAPREKEYHYLKLHVQSLQLLNHITLFQIPFAKGLAVQFSHFQVYGNAREGVQLCSVKAHFCVIPSQLFPGSPNLVDRGQISQARHLRVIFTSQCFPCRPVPLFRAQVRPIPSLQCLGFSLSPTPFHRYILHSVSANRCPPLHSFFPSRAIVPIHNQFSQLQNVLLQQIHISEVSTPSYPRSNSFPPLQFFFILARRNNPLLSTSITLPSCSLNTFYI